MKYFRNGLITGLTLQLAIGPVFFYITNLTLQKSIFDGFAGVLAVTLVDFIYISLSILGIGKLLENKKFKRIFGIISSVVLIVFGGLIIKGVIDNSNVPSTITLNSDVINSFITVFVITISSPMTIIFFTSLFSAKALEYNFAKKDLIKFGLGTGFATFVFMGFSVILFSIIKASIPLLLIQILNLLVGILLVVYGSQRLFKVRTNT